MATKASSLVAVFYYYSVADLSSVLTVASHGFAGFGFCQQRFVALIQPFYTCNLSDDAGIYA